MARQTQGDQVLGMLVAEVLVTEVMYLEATFAVAASTTKALPHNRLVAATAPLS
jgi:uncharacterized membrane protein YcfT